MCSEWPSARGIRWKCIEGRERTTMCAMKRNQHSCRIRKAVQNPSLATWLYDLGEFMSVSLNFFTAKLGKTAILNISLGLSCPNMLLLHLGQQQLSPPACSGQRPWAVLTPPFLSHTTPICEDTEVPDKRTERQNGSPASSSLPELEQRKYTKHSSCPNWLPF